MKIEKHHKERAKSVSLTGIIYLIVGILFGNWLATDISTPVLSAFKSIGKYAPSIAVLLGLYQIFRKRK